MSSSSATLKSVNRAGPMEGFAVSVQFSSNTTGIWDEEGQPTAPKKKKKKKKKKKQTTPSAGNEGHGVIDAKATARVFKLEELAIRIATQLHAISPKSVVKLALTCRALEAPALGALWENQGSLSSLIKRVLLTDILYFGFPDPEEDTCLLSLQRPLTSRELNRLKRYASWMRRLEVYEWDLSKEITRLVLPSSDGTPPALPLHLRELSWRLDETNLSFLPNFISPHLKTIMITTTASRPFPLDTVELWPELPNWALPVMRSVIKALPSSPQIFVLKLGVGPETRLTTEVSTFALGYGEELQQFCNNVVLSTKAIVHLMKLPNLRTWTTEQGPPQVADLIHHGVPDGVVSLFPSLETLDLWGAAAFEWLSIFEAAKNRTPPWILARGSLPKVTYHHRNLPIDSSLVSRFLPFTDLVELRISMECMFLGPCVSRFTDEDVERLTAALPKLEAVTFGESPCRFDTCPTTIRSLLSFSIHCPKLRYLNMHFRTADLRADMLDLLGYAYSQGLHSRPKCILKTLVTKGMPLKLSDYDPVLLSMGMLMIFPSLGQFYSRSPRGPWVQLQAVAMALGKIKAIPTLTEQLMRSLDEVRVESAGGGIPANSADNVARTLCEPYSLLLGVCGIGG